MVEEPQDIGGLWTRVAAYGETLAKHSAEIEALRESTRRVESLVAEVKGEMRDRMTELRSELGRGIDRLGTDIREVAARNLEALTPQAAQELAELKSEATRARESEKRARQLALALISAFVLTLGALVTALVH